MPYAVTHVLLTIILVDIYRDYFAKKNKKYFTLHTILVAGIGGLLSDIDVPLNWLFNIFGYTYPLFEHGGITHTPFFGLLFLVPAFILLNKKKHKSSMYFFVLSFGVLLHILLDYVLGGGAHTGIMFFWPLSTAGYKIHLLNQLGLSNVPAALDALILLGWLYHEEGKHKIKDFI